MKVVGWWWWWCSCKMIVVIKFADKLAMAVIRKVVDLFVWNGNLYLYKQIGNDEIRDVFASSNSLIDQFVTKLHIIINKPSDLEHCGCCFLHNPSDKLCEFDCPTVG